MPCRSSTRRTRYRRLRCRLTVARYAARRAVLIAVIRATPRAGANGPAPTGPDRTSTGRTRTGRARTGR
ncbi:hypothetical protein [Streptomyces sp. MBT27]|uniref:hypothetical protein n=1 Tax=Streptomyces sp. MBT27 TaxID=1488356 RepID=UPI0014222069|nr:hypothetical protein [Streptomyces sp. MBT27]